MHRSPSTKGLRQILLQANRGKSLGERLKPFLKLRPIT
jgi:acetyl-CoA C-acetyltransferase